MVLIISNLIMGYLITYFTECVYVYMYISEMWRVSEL